MKKENLVQILLILVLKQAVKQRWSLGVKSSGAKKTISTILVSMPSYQDMVVDTQDQESGGSRFETCSGVWYPRWRPCGVVNNTLIDLINWLGKPQVYESNQRNIMFSHWSFFLKEASDKINCVFMCSLVIWFSRKFWSWMVLFELLLDQIVTQFVSSFDRVNGLSIFQFDAVLFIDFSANFFDWWVQWIRDSCFCL